MRPLDREKLYRLIDANLNRAKEGLRVVEDICRFVLDRQAETRKLKSIRHRLTHALRSLQKKELLAARDSDKDVGRPSTKKEFKRKNVADIMYANLQRVEESLRVLEEFLKLSDRNLAESMKSLRYEVYAVEKKISQYL